MENLKVKQTFLYTLIGSIAVSALLGIWAILSGDFGEFQARVLMTTLTIVGTSILGLSCGALLESAKSADSALKIVPLAGIVLAIISAVLTLALIWQIFSSQNEAVYKTIAIAGLFAFTLAQLSLLSLANLSQQFQWILSAVYLAALILALIVSVLIIFEPNGESNFVLRTIGVLGVIDAALTVLIPVFHRLSRGDLAKNETTIGLIEAEISDLQKKIEKLEAQKQEILEKSK